MTTQENRPALREVALLGNYLPRKCGIATFTTDLLTALAAERPETAFRALAMNDLPEGYRYPAEVRFELNQRLISDYRMAADLLNMNQVDVVCVQHEYGIFGGECGAHVLELVAALRMPVVTTLHSVLDTPTDGQLAVLKRLARISDRLIVMSQRAVGLLKDVYDVPEEKIAMVHHGIPNVPFIDPNYYKDLFGVEGRKVILTFGLLSPGKGIEYMIDALPEIVARYPDAVYLVLGATHPHIKIESGEAYRFSLQRRARDLGVGEHVIFHNRFVEIEELCQLLGAADIYVTPYLNKDQIVSGTLAYALGTGNATISTPYWYATEMLDEGRGRIVPFRDAAALSAEVIDLFTNEVERHAMRKRAYAYCRDMIWSEVAKKYLQIFSEAKDAWGAKPHVPLQARTVSNMTREAPEIKLDHLIRLTDGVGVIQHAKYTVPNRHYGYCTDDNARALIATLMAIEVLGEREKRSNLVSTYLSFLHFAFNDTTGRFRNFMSYERTWQEEIGSEDSHSRAVWALGEAVARTTSDDIRGLALEMFEKSLPPLVDFTSPRAWAIALIGIHAYLRKFGGDTEVRRIREVLAYKLYMAYEKTSTDDWPWIEESLTYANGKIPQALIISGQWLRHDGMLQAGLRSLQWLLSLQVDPKGHFVPVGNNGWLEKGGEMARFDQQPIEAHNMIEACLEAHAVTGEEHWIASAQLCLEWFLGRNDLKDPLYDHKTGGCRDGLTPEGPNRNQGAESTLAFLLSLLGLYNFRSAHLTSDRVQEISGEKKELVHVN